MPHSSGLPEIQKLSCISALFLNTRSCQSSQHYRNSGGGFSWVFRRYRRNKDIKLNESWFKKVYKADFSHFTKTRICFSYNNSAPWLQSMALKQNQPLEDYQKDTSLKGRSTGQNTKGPLRPLMKWMALGYYWNMTFLQGSFKVCLFNGNLLISMSPPTQTLMTQSSSQRWYGSTFGGPVS